MGFTIKPYEMLKIEFNKQLMALLEKHKISSVDELKVPRLPQVLFLNKMIELLDKTDTFGKMKEKEAVLKKKAEILTAAFIVITHEIEDKEYGGMINSIVFDKEESLFFKALRCLAGGDEKDKIDNLTKSRLVHNMWKFFGSRLFLNGDTTKELLANHPFSDNKTLDIVDLWNRCLNIDATARIEWMKNAVKPQYKKFAVFLDNILKDISSDEQPQIALNQEKTRLEKIEKGNKGDNNYCKLKTVLEEVLIKLRGKKNKESFDKLAEPRRHQALFLMRAIELLDKADHFGTITDPSLVIARKEKILRGLILGVRAEIIMHENKGNKTKARTSSKLCEMLEDEALTSSETFHYNNANQVSQMLRYGMKFFEQTLFETTHESGIEPFSQVPKDHPYSDIKKFDINIFYNACILFNTMCSKEVMKDAYTLVYGEKQRSMFNFINPKKTDKQTMNTQDLIMNNN